MRDELGLRALQGHVDEGMGETFFGFLETTKNMIPWILTLPSNERRRSETNGHGPLADRSRSVPAATGEVLVRSAPRQKAVTAQAR